MSVFLIDAKLYSPQMVITIYKYTIENNLTNKREKNKVEKHTQTNGIIIEPKYTLAVWQTGGRMDGRTPYRYIMLSARRCQPY